METLHNYVEYSEDSYTFLIWKVSVKNTNIKAGNPAGSFDSSRGYYVTKINGKKYKNHRIIYYLHYGVVGDVVDHIDGNKKNNHKNNLRSVTIELNNRNLSVRKDSKTGISGVFKRDKYYVASYYDFGKRKTKFFDCAKLGDDVAIQQATEWRKSKLQELNVGYTERHGT